MDENLQVVLTADVRQANKSVNNFKNTLNGLNNRNLFLTVLKSEKSKIKILAD